MARYGYLSRTDPWPDGDILYAHRGDFPPVPITQFPVGLTLYHGTAVADDFSMPRPLSNFTTSMRLAKEYAEMESDGPSPRVLAFRTAKRIPNIVDFPSVW